MHRDLIVECKRGRIHVAVDSEVCRGAYALPVTVNPNADRTCVLSKVRSIGLLSNRGDSCEWGYSNKVVDLIEYMYSVDHK